MLKKMFSIVLCIVLCCGISFVTEADCNTKGVTSVADSNIQPCYDYTSTVSTKLNSPSGKAVCTANVNGYDGLTTKIKITMTLQKKALLWWSAVETWTTTVSDFYATLSKTATVESRKYRVKAEYVVYSGSNSESITQYSSELEF